MNLKPIALLATLLAGSALCAPAFAGDAEKGKAKSATCAACHGSNGISMIPMYPNLAGQKEQYLVLQMKAFRSGERNNMVMAPMAKGLSDEDIADLAAYFASLNPAG
ncbi:cytochrome c [Aliiglaciecola sp. 3_MG-2023]|uniref:c-type cytochrome n=1 Tax=Aliiglaciecola sp. 3_MG-2023 TaxID=3062644 RepID=UPI0026E4422A|nr:cytochrome c [Aliiglaciecola sp. 3_MG-2023]MDO6695470.1 cytochrome c [Aliiglaciecola sp. 3_MG-2023]